MNEELRKAADQTARAIEDKIKALVPVKTGKLRDSIKAVVTSSGQLIDIQIDGESYFKYVDGDVEHAKGNIKASVSGKIGPKTNKMASKRDGRMQPKHILGQFDAKESDFFSSDLLAQAFAKDVDTEITNILNRIFK